MGQNTMHNVKTVTNPQSLSSTECFGAIKVILLVLKPTISMFWFALISTVYRRSRQLIKPTVHHVPRVLKVGKQPVKSAVFNSEAYKS